jgi:hypothetical protein
MIKSILAMAILAMVLCGTPAVADEDKDLNLIPNQPQQPKGAPASSTASSNQRIYLTNALTEVSHRVGLVVPVPPPPPFDWQDRLLLDIRTDWQLGEHLRIVYSDRFNVRGESDLPFPDHENIVNDLREAYASWQRSDQTYVDFGRINLKSGIALGYNPTDFFRTRAVSEPLSADPTVLREDRLGTVMVRMQRIWQGGALTVAFAPRTHQPSPIYSNGALPSLNPMFDRTNSSNRFLVKGTLDLAGHASPEILLYRESGQTRLGTNISFTVGQSLVTYLEWSGGQRSNLITEALDYGRDTGPLPPNAPSVQPTSVNKTFKSELALGASYTTANNITFNLEYHLNQAGFSSADWNNWFAAGNGMSAGSPTVGELWYIRGYAQDQRQQNTQQAAFARADWVDAFGLKLELSGFANVDLHDGSGVVQAAANYYRSDAWTIGGLADVNFGSRRSDFGSLGSSYSVLFSVTRYF